MSRKKNNGKALKGARAKTHDEPTIDPVWAASFKDVLTGVGGGRRGWISAALGTAVKRTKRGVGGRKKLAQPNKKFFQIGRAVEDEIPRCQRGFETLRELKREHPTDRAAWERRLAEQNFSALEIQALLSTRTPKSAAKFFVALSLKDKRHPKGLSLQTVKSSYSRYLAATRNS